MPLGVSYPEHQIFRAEVMVPTVALIQPEERTVENPSFYFHRLVNVSTGKLFLEYEYRALSDAVQPQAVPAYVRQLNEAGELMDYTISAN
jgi:hypothetical protein